MADNMLMRVCTLGLSMLFEKKEADLNQPIHCVSARLKRIGVTEGAIRSLLNKATKLDYVVVPANFVEEFTSRASASGSFGVYVQDCGYEALVELLKGSNLISSDVSRLNNWNRINRYRLKDLFPDEFQDRYFCPGCDHEKASQSDPCENGECRMGISNFKQMQQVNAVLEAQINQMRKDGSSILSMDEVKELMIHKCPFCGSTDLDPMDEDGELYCNDCEEYHDPQNDYLSQDEEDDPYD